MKPYVFFQHTDLRAVHAFDLVEFASDREAGAARAQWLLADNPAEHPDRDPGRRRPDLYDPRPRSTAPQQRLAPIAKLSPGADCPIGLAYPSNSSAVERPPRLKRSGPSMRRFTSSPRDMSIHIAIAGLTVLVALAAPLIISIADALKPDAR